MYVALACLAWVMTLPHKISLSLVCAFQIALKDVCTAVLLSIEQSGMAALLAYHCMVGLLSSQDHAQKLRCGMTFKGLAC